MSLKSPLFVLLCVLATLLCVASVYTWANRQSDELRERYNVTQVSAGDIVRSVTASGTINPTTVVNVGTQVSGSISRLYVDYNDTVHVGQLLAEVDPSVYAAAVSQSRANLSSAQAAFRLSIETERRTRMLFDQGILSEQILDEAIQGRVAAKAQVSLVEAQLSRDLSNLGYTKVYAPIAGVVMSREVAVGQTVVASFQTPVLFKIAQDLKKMQIECRVPEADIGGVRIGQSAEFATDAFPEKRYRGKVRQIRIDPKFERNLVNYSVIVDAENDDGRLLPGMTALVGIVLEIRRNVLRVPASALTFQPQDAGPQNAITVLKGNASVYTIYEQSLHRVPVTAGISDGKWTEVSSPQLQQGASVVVSVTPSTTH